MKIGVRWQIKGVGEEARETAREAARRAGMSVGEWLDNAIIDSAEARHDSGRRVCVDEFDDPPYSDEPDDELPPRRGRYRDDEEDRYPGERPRRRRKYADYDERQRRDVEADIEREDERRRHDANTEIERREDERSRRDAEMESERGEERRRRAAEIELAEVNDRIDFLTRQLQELTRYSESAHDDSDDDKERLTAESRHIADAITRLDTRLDQLISEGRAATSEIFERMNAVENTHASPDRMRATLPTSPSTPLDQALLEIADRQRALDGDITAPPPGPRSRPEPALAELPRAPTQGFAELESQLRNINKRIETMGASTIEKGVETLRNDLAEIGVMLKDAMPRQSIEALEGQVRALSERLDQTRHAGGNGGTSDAAAANLEGGLAEVRDALRALTPKENLVGLDDAVRGLGDKIDVIATQTQDPGALRQLEGAIVALRGIVSHVASNDALTNLSDEVRDLASKVERIASSASGGDMLATLEQRIATIADALQARGGQTSQDARNLEHVVAGLTDKLERLQLTRSEHSAVGHLEDRIVKLVEKLDASDSRLSHLESIERGLAELLIHIEHQRVPNVTNGGASRPEVDVLKRDVQQTQDSLEAVHGTLGDMVDRLAQIETRMRSAPAPQAPPVARVAATAPTLAPAPAPVQAPPPAPAPLAAAPIKPALPPLPAARPMQLVSEPAAAPAAKPKPMPAAQHERAPIDPNLPPDHPLEPGAMRGRPSTPSERVAAAEAALGGAKPPVIPDPGGKSNFIAAARRAAKIALAEPPASAQPHAAPAEPESNPKGKLGGRVRSLLVGTGVLLIVLSSIHLITNLLSSSDEPPPAESQSTEPAEAPAAAPAPAEVAPPAAVEPPPAPTPKAVPAPPVRRQSSIIPRGDGSYLDVPETVASSTPPEPTRQADASAPDFGIAVPDIAGITGSIRPPATPLPVPAPAPALPARPTEADRLPAGIGHGGLRAAAVKGDASAEYEIAVRYAEGHGVTQNYGAAADWFEKAAKQNLPPAQFRLGGLYEKGMGVKKNLETAHRLYSAAAEGGNAKAMHNLAVLYAEGLDGKPDFPTAARWFRKAAGYGVADSQYNLGILYARGIGVEPNLPEAYKWFALAARAGDKEAAKKRDDVGSRLDPASLRAAMTAIQGFTADIQPEGAAQPKVPAGGWDAVPAPKTQKPRSVGPKVD